MKICVFGDIHGNLKPLQQFVQTDDFLKADLRICLGDTVGLGPYQKECVDLLENYPYVYLLGNHEGRMIGLINDFSKELDEKLFLQYESSKNILKDYIPKFSKLERNYDMVLAGKKIRFTHYGWYNDNMSNKESAVKNKDLMTQFGLKENEFDYVIYGHIHSPSEKIENGTTFFDVGSFGLKCPSNYLIIDDTDGKLTLTRKTINYDVSAFLSDCERIHYPRWDILTQFSFDNNLEKNIVVFK